MTQTYMSDVFVRFMKDVIGIRHIFMNPGASLSGLHQSLADGVGPEPVLALNEIAAVSMADGYARASEAALAGVALHDLVGLQAGSMGIYNAWMNRSPMIIVGGSGPRVIAKRRPWLDWAHSSKDQSAFIADFVKWRDEPATTAHAIEALAFAWRAAVSGPGGPTYLAIDAALQEEDAGPSVASLLALRRPGRQNPIALPGDAVREIAAAVHAAEFPVITADFTGASSVAYAALDRWASLVGCPVIDLGARHNIANGHDLDGTDIAADLLSKADLVLALDPRDPMMGLASVAERPVDAAGLSSGAVANQHVITIGLHSLRHHGSVDPSSFGLAADNFLADTAVCLPQLSDRYALLPRVDRTAQRSFLEARRARRQAEISDMLRTHRLDMTTPTVLRAVADVTAGDDWVVANGEARGWMRRTRGLNTWNSYLGRNVGAGLGYGPGASAGAAFALADSGKCVLDIQNDGDLLSSASSLWTMAHARLPILIVVLNNHSYGQDRMHQENLRRERERSLDSVGVGVDIEQPIVDFAALGRAQGIESWGPIESVEELESTVRIAASVVANEHRPALIDVSVRLQLR